MAARKARSARSCARAPTRSTWRNSSIITDERIYGLLLEGNEQACFDDMQAVDRRTRRLRAGRDRGDDDMIGIVTVA